MEMDKAAILSRGKRKVVAVPVDDDVFYVRSLTLGEKNKYEAGNYKLVNGKPVLCLDTADARLASLVMCDKDGNRLFNDLEAAELQHVDAPFMEKPLSTAKTLNGLAGDAEAERKNSPTTLNGASS